MDGPSQPVSFDRGIEPKPVTPDWNGPLAFIDTSFSTGRSCDSPSPARDLWEPGLLQCQSVKDVQVNFTPVARELAPAGVRSGVSWLCETG